MTSSRIKQADWRHARTSGVRLRGCDKVAERCVETFAKRLERLQIDLGSVPLRSPFKCSNVFDDSGHRIDNTLHRLKDPRRRIRPTSGEETVNRRDETSDVNVDEAAVPGNRELVVDFGRLEEQLRGRCTPGISASKSGGSGGRLYLWHCGAPSSLAHISACTP